MCPPPPVYTWGGGGVEGGEGVGGRRGIETLVGEDQHMYGIQNAYCTDVRTQYQGAGKGELTGLRLGSDTNLVEWSS